MIRDGHEQHPLQGGDPQMDLRKPYPRRQARHRQGVRHQGCGPHRPQACPARTGGRRPSGKTQEDLPRPRPSAARLGSTGQRSRQGRRSDRAPAGMAGRDGRAGGASGAARLGPGAWRRGSHSRPGHVDRGRDGLRGSPDTPHRAQPQADPWHLSRRGGGRSPRAHRQGRRSGMDGAARCRAGRQGW